MFFRRHHHRPSLLKLILVFLGLGFLVKRNCRQERSEEERAEFRAKAREFRGKLREAFAVWDEEPTGEATADQPKAE